MSSMQSIMCVVLIICDINTRRAWDLVSLRQKK